MDTRIKPIIATFKLHDEFTPAMDAIRVTGFPPKDGSKTLRDEFDLKGKSVHLTLEVAGEIAVYHRFTDNLDGRQFVLEPWTNFKAPVPRGEPTMEMGRFVINENLRGHFPDLFDSFVLIGLIYAKKAGYHKVVTAIKDERNLVDRTATLGFDKQNTVVNCVIPHCATVPVRTLVYDLDRNSEQLLPKFFKATTELLKNSNVKLNCDFLNSVNPVVKPESISTLRSKL